MDSGDTDGSAYVNGNEWAKMVDMSGMAESIINNEAFSPRPLRFWPLL